MTGMSKLGAVVETDMTQFEDALRGPTIHSYPGDPKYRRSGNAVPQVGDVARCGHVKNCPPVPPEEVGRVTCAQCRLLKAMA